MHGALGWWDEVLCLIPSVLLILLAYYIYRSDRKQKTQVETQLDAGADESQE